MMRNLRATIALLALPTVFFAQTLSYSGRGTSASIAGTTANAPASKAKDETPEQARKLVMSLLNNFRGFAVSADELKKGDSESDEPSTSEKEKQLRRLSAKNGALPQPQSQSIGNGCHKRCLASC